MSMLAARASPNRDIVITQLGRRSGTAPSKELRRNATHRGGAASRPAISAPFESVISYNAAQLASLTRLGVPHHLTLVPNADEDLCVQTLMPRGMCCGWVGDGVTSKASSRLRVRNMTLHPSTPILMLKWWFMAAATREGYNVLSLDADVRHNRNPLELLHSPQMRNYGLVLTGDFGFPEYPGSRDKYHVDYVPVPCDTPSPTGQTCECGETATPGINTGYVWVRGSEPGVVSFVASTNERLHAILNGEVPNYTELDQLLASKHTFEQDVANEQLYRLASTDRGSTQKELLCHPLDNCQRRAKEASRQGGVKRIWSMQWWATPGRQHSAWTASTLPADGPVSESDCAAAVAERRQLFAHASIGGGSRVAVLPPSLAARLCGAHIYLARFVRSSKKGEPDKEPLGCDSPHYHRGASFLGSTMLHMMAADPKTRKDAWAALDWFDARNEAKDVHAAKPMCKEVTGARVGVTLSSSASANLSLVCAVDTPRASACPCCWEQRGKTTLYRSHVDTLMGCLKWRTAW